MTIVVKLSVRARSGSLSAQTLRAFETPLGHSTKYVVEPPRPPQRSLTGLSANSPRPSDQVISGAAVPASSATFENVMIPTPCCDSRQGSGISK